MAEKQIASVSDNKEKQQSYRQQIGRYKIAMREGFYYEALLIVYAMIEDRLRSFLYHIGALRHFNSTAMDCKKSRQPLRILYFGSEENSRNKSLDINTYSKKRDLILKTLGLVDEEIPENAYLKLLREEYVRYIDVGGLKDVLNETDDWCNYRNEVVHGLLNKNLTALDDELKEKVEQGMEYARFIDNQIKELKKRNTIRKYLKLK